MSCSAEAGIADPITSTAYVGTPPPVGGERSPLLAGRHHTAAIARRGKTILAALYAIQVFYSFFIM